MGHFESQAINKQIQAIAHFVKENLGNQARNHLVFLLKNAECRPFIMVPTRILAAAAEAFKEVP
jgi:hypothetical protein